MDSVILSEPCTIADIGMEITGADAEPIITALGEYLSVFAKPNRVDGHHKCLKCGATLDGFLGSFTWGIQWGEGRCTECGWPGRGYHVPKDAEDKIFNVPLQIILQYREAKLIPNDDT